MEVYVFPFIRMKVREEEFYTEYKLYVQWQNVHLALLLLPSANVHSLKEKTNGFKPNGATPSEVTSTSL